MKTRRRYPITRLLALILLAAGIIGLALRYTVRDRVDVLAPVFYGLAPAVVFILATVALGLWLRARARFGSVLAGVVTIVAFVAWLQTDYVRNPRPADGRGDLRIVMWNIARPSEGEYGFIGPLQRANGDIMLVAESQAYGEDRHDFWRSHFPEHHVRLVGAGITLLSRAPVSRMSMYAMGEHTYIVSCEMATDFGPMTVVAVDIESDIW